MGPLQLALRLEWQALQEAGLVLQSS